MNAPIFHDDQLCPNQVAIVDATGRVKYRRPTGDPLVQEALTARGYFVVGPIVRIRHVLDNMPPIADVRVAIDGECNWAAVGHPESDPFFKPEGES